MATSVIPQTSRRVLVIPLIRVTPSLTALSYNVPAGLEVSPGGCVQIPFRTKTIEGIVWAEDTTKKRKGTKSILSRKENFCLTTEQLAIAKWLQQQTLTPLNIILRSMVLGERRESQTKSRAQSKVTIVECPTGLARQKVLMKWSQRIAAKVAYTLIVVPNQGAASQWMALLKNLKPLHIVPPRGATAQRRLLTDLRATKTYITTHAGLLYPLPPIDRVILDLADDEGYFAFDQAPRVDLRALTITFARAHCAALLVLTRWLSPAVVGTLGSSEATRIGERPVAILIDRQNEPPGERGHLPPSYLLERLQKTRTLWLHSQTSEAGRYVCSDCGTAVLCPTCTTPLRVRSRNPLILECVRDHLKIAAPSTCTHCKGTKLSTRGPGIQQVARTIAELTGSQTVATLERGTVQGDLESALHVVSTTAIGSYPALTFAAAVILQPDSYFSQQGYRSAEQFFSAFALARAAVTPQGSLFIVTYKPETLAYTFLNNPNSWTDQTLRERAELNYPPAGTMVVLQPRKRVTNPTPQPFHEMHIPNGISKVIIKNSWLLRAANLKHDALLQCIQQYLDPSWEAIVNPPALPQD